MLIIPFIHRATPVNNITVHYIKILTVGGHTLWEEENNSDIINDILLPNDIHVKSIKYINNTYICEVDKDKTNIYDIYNWNEIELLSDTICWKDFIYLEGKNDEVWLDIPSSELITKDLIKSIIM
jgi:hypothetical protein